MQSVSCVALDELVIVCFQGQASETGIPEPYFADSFNADEVQDVHLDIFWEVWVESQVRSLPWPEELPKMNCSSIFNDQLHCESRMRDAKC